MSTPTRAQLLRDVAILQVKLIADGVRDLLLSPVALCAGLWAALSGRPAAAAFFYDVIRFGRRTEEWIDPFGIPPPGEPGAERPAGSLDETLARVEHEFVEQYRRAGVSAAAKSAAEQARVALEQARAALEKLRRER